MSPYQKIQTEPLTLTPKRIRTTQLYLERSLQNLFDSIVLQFQMLQILQEMKRRVAHRFQLIVAEIQLLQRC